MIEFKKGNKSHVDGKMCWSKEGTLERSDSGIYGGIHRITSALGEGNHESEAGAESIGCFFTENKMIGRIYLFHFSCKIFVWLFFPLF